MKLWNPEKEFAERGKLAAVYEGVEVYAGQAGAGEKFELGKDVNVDEKSVPTEGNDGIDPVWVYKEFVGKDGNILIEKK